jgi:serine protease Do
MHPSSPPPPCVAAAKSNLGVAVRLLSPEERRRSGEIANGVVVENVGGAAAIAGVRPGDVIVSFDRTPVKSPEQLRILVANAGKTVALLVLRDEAKLLIPATIG